MSKLLDTVTPSAENGQAPLDFVMVFLVALIGNLWNRSPFPFSKKACSLLESYAGRDEVLKAHK